MRAESIGRVRLAACVAALCLGGCASTGAGLLSPQAKVLATPIEHQDTLYECGLVAVSTLCAYHGVEIPADERARLAQLAAQEHGLSGAELETELQHLGFEVYLFQGTLGDEPTGLRHQVDAGRPVLVMTSEDGSDHYSLVIGHDPGTDSLVLLDPRRGRVVLPTAAFARTWEAARRFALLAVPASDNDPSKATVSQARVGP